MLSSINPTTGEVIAEWPSLNAEELDMRIECASKAFSAWRQTSFAHRASALKRIASALRERKVALAEMMAREMGKPVAEGVPEVEKGAWCLEHYADNAEAYLAEQEIPSDAMRSCVSYEPLGVVLAILPWNAPCWLPFRCLAPSLMAGNVCAMKHDPLVQGTAAMLMEAFAHAELPEGVVVNLPLENSLVERAIRHRGVAAVSFTGSARTGAEVAALAASEIKPVVLELGGSDPCVVLNDADLERAADTATLSRMINAGQSCIAAKRIIVERGIYDQFLAMLEERLPRLLMGDPLNPETTLGPLARADLRATLHRQVELSVEEGARLRLGGHIPDGPGFFYPPTLLSGVGPGMTVFDEETFGPVMVVCPAEDTEHALQLANHSMYGLGAAIWTHDSGKIQHFVRELQAGQVAVNGIVKTDPRLPSGGIKRSGIGRELGPHGIHEFVNAKQVWLGKA